MTAEGLNDLAIWSPEGRSLTFNSDRAGSGDEWNLFRARLDGKLGRTVFEARFSPGGDYVAYTVVDEFSSHVWRSTSLEHTHQCGPGPFFIRGLPTRTTAWVGTAVRPTPDECEHLQSPIGYVRVTDYAGVKRRRAPRLHRKERNKYALDQKDDVR